MRKRRCQKAYLIPISRDTRLCLQKIHQVVHRVSDVNEDYLAKLRRFSPG
jgi:hypothetical protein